MRHPLRPPPAVLLILACAFWGVATVLNKALLASIAPAALLVIQLVPSAMSLWTIVLISGKPLPQKSVLIPLIWLGILNPGISYTLGLIGLTSVPANVTTLLWASEPLMTLGLAALILGEPIGKRLLFVMLIGGLGVAFVANVFNGTGSSTTDPTGVILLLSAVLCCALYTVYCRKLSDNVDPLFAIAVQQIAGLCAALVFLFANTRYGSVADIPAIPPKLVAAAAFSGILYYAAAYWLFLAALRSVSAAVAASYFNVIPIFGIAFAYVLLGEVLSPLQWAGAGAIVISVYLLVRLTKSQGDP